ncbi:UNVERIFIED_CONTAM: hypothetical protein FKN15_034862 [Acipenser sinensis]
MEQTAERFGAVSRHRGEGESMRAALEELRQRGKEVGEAIAGKHGVRRKMAALLGSSVGATPAEKAEKAEGTGRKCGHVEEDVNKTVSGAPREIGERNWESFKKDFEQKARLNNWNGEMKLMQLTRCLSGEEFEEVDRALGKQKVAYETVIACLDEMSLDRARHGRCSTSSREAVFEGEDAEQATVQRGVTDRRVEVKAGRYDGRSDWEAYRAKFQIVAQANGWNQRERAVRLAAALEGEALRALLDLNEAELADSQAVLTALDRRFGSAEPAVNLRQRLASRSRQPGEKLGVFAAEVRYLARKGYPTFTAEAQEDLATEAFLRGLTPESLRQHVRLSAPTSLELALKQAKVVEEVLEEGTLTRTSGRNPDSYPRTQARPARQMEIAEVGSKKSLIHVSAHHYHPCADSGGAKMNTRCPPKRVPSAARFFTLCRLTVQPPQSYSVGGQRSSGQLTGKPAIARPDYRGRWCAVSRGHPGHPGRPNPPSPRTTLGQLSAAPLELLSTVGCEIAWIRTGDVQAIKRILHSSKKLVQYSQKLPQATFEELAKITDQIAHMVSTCCKGEMINCMKERKQLADDVCSKDELLSRTKHLAECCKLSIIERGGCIEKMEADDKPQDLSEKDDSFIKDKDVCEKYAQHGDQFLGSFLYEFSRRHPELSIQMILRVGKGYEAILDKCCKTDNPSECYGGAEEQLVLAIKETLVHFQQLCAAEKTFGKEGFEEFMLVQYTRIMPQAPYDKLMRVAHTIATVTDSCCSKDESHLMPCAEEQLTNAIDETCSETNPATINEHIDHCCNESYSERRTCILKIQPDTTFVPQPFSPDMFHLDPDMCDMAPKELFATTTRLLYETVKLKTTITDEQFLTIGTSFLLLKAKCCTDADKALCFKAEKVAISRFN